MIRNTAQERLEAELEAEFARYERIIKAATVLTDQEKAELSAWEKHHVTGDGQLDTSDWPGWDAVIYRISH